MTIDKFGRVVIPQEVREALHLRAGAKLELAFETDRSIVLKVVPEEAGLEWRNGVPLIVGRGPVADIDVVELIRKDREERDRKIMGM